MERKDVYAVVDAERDYQDNKWGKDKEQSLPGYLLIMQKEINEAVAGWIKDDSTRRNTPLEEIVQVVATGVKCLEVYGVKGSAEPTNDITEEKLLQRRRDASEAKFGAR